MSKVQIDQAPVQIVHGDESKVQVDQAPIQIVHGDESKIRIDQAAIQILQQATARNVLIDQCVVQLIVEALPSGNFWPVILRMLDQQRSTA